MPSQLPPSSTPPPGSPSGSGVLARSFAAARAALVESGCDAYYRRCAASGGSPAGSPPPTPPVVRVSVVTREAGKVFTGRPGPSLASGGGAGSFAGGGGDGGRSTGGTVLCMAIDAGGGETVAPGNPTGVGTLGGVVELRAGDAFDLPGSAVGRASVAVVTASVVRVYVDAAGSPLWYAEVTL